MAFLRETGSRRSSLPATCFQSGIFLAADATRSLTVAALNATRPPLPDGRGSERNVPSAPR